MLMSAGLLLHRQVHRLADEMFLSAGCFEQGRHGMLFYVVCLGPTCMFSGVLRRVPCMSAGLALQQKICTCLVACSGCSCKV
jgi:hypothetical protein